jgi:hypothetical protein
MPQRVSARLPQMMGTFGGCLTTKAQVSGLFVAPEADFV